VERARAARASSIFKHVGFAAAIDLDLVGAARAADAFPVVHVAAARKAKNPAVCGGFPKIPDFQPGREIVVLQGRI